MNVATKIILHAREGDLLEALSKQRLTPRRLRMDPRLGGEGASARRINRLLASLRGVDRDRGDRYLEIGLEDGYTFESVRAGTRWGVEPCPRFSVRHLPPGAHVAVTTSDEFFNLNLGISFDVVFIDGLHTFRQTYRDLVNACRLCPHGAVVIDDVVPLDEASAIPDKELSLQERRRLGLKSTPWHGDVFRVVLAIAKHHPELSFRTMVGDKPQALVWRNDPAVDVKSVSESALKTIEATSFADVFEQGIPASFLPRSESEAIDDWMSARP